jgi:RNA polymerase-binding protein DksA
LPADLDAMRGRLEVRRDQLLNRTEKIERDLRTLRDPDSQERVTESENDEVLEGLGDAERSELSRIRHALQRLDAGTYTTCERCGEEIPSGRLNAVPQTSTCVGCAEG